MLSWLFVLVVDGKKRVLMSDLFVDTGQPLLGCLFPFPLSSSLSPKLRKQIQTFVNFLACECPIFMTDLV